MEVIERFEEDVRAGRKIRIQKVTIKARGRREREGEKEVEEKKKKKKKEKECRRRSFLCKVRIERRIRTSPSAMPPSVPPYTDSARPAEVSPAFFTRRLSRPSTPESMLPSSLFSRCSCQRRPVSKLSDEIFEAVHKAENRASAWRRWEGET